MEIAIIDTETTGLLVPSPAGLEKQPQIIELYACIIDEDFNMLREYESFYNPGVPLPEIIPKITGITDDMLADQPTFSAEYPKLAKFFTGVDMMVAHNMNFDESMIANELLRVDKLIKFPWPRHHICTVEASMRLKGYRLNLTKLHKAITGKDFKDAHRARNDVMALVRSFHGLCNKGFIKLENYE